MLNFKQHFDIFLYNYYSIYFYSALITAEDIIKYLINYSLNQ